MCGDNQTDLKEFVKDVAVSQLNTDPPYGVQYSTKNDFVEATLNSSLSVKEQYSYDELDRDFTELFNNIFKQIIFKYYNTIYIWCASNEHLFEIKKSLENNNITYSQLLVWLKNQFVPSRLDYLQRCEFCFYAWKGKHRFYSKTPDRTTVLEFNKPCANKLHPTMKPIEMIQQIIKDGTREEEIVLDPFLGSGSTLIACEQTNRICYGMEIDEHYCSIIIKRWELYTGMKAEKLTNSNEDVNN